MSSDFNAILDAILSFCGLRPSRQGTHSIEVLVMADNDITPRPGRIRDSSRSRQPNLKQQIFKQAGTTGLAATWSKGHIKPGAMRRGMGTGLRAAAGLIAPGSRRVIVKARYTTISGGDLGAARAHLKYIQRDGVTREGEAGQLYDATGSEADGLAFLDRSTAAFTMPNLAGCSRAPCRRAA